MSSKKNIGSYYTPDNISAFIFKYIAKDLIVFPRLSILEPSVGEGTFVKAFKQARIAYQNKAVSFTCIELIESELLKAKKTADINTDSNTTYEFVHGDFLEIQRDIESQFDLVIGNPPYISKKILTDLQIKAIEEIHASASLSNHSIKNIWTAFLIKGCQLLSEKGIVSYILPSEILQVSFAKELRAFISELFERVEIFTFSELLFDCKGQDTVLLIAHKKHAQKGQFYTHIDDVADLQTQNFVLRENDALSTNNTKWSHHSLEAQDIGLAYKWASSLKPITFYCNSSPGIVTAANQFFIINSETEHRYNLTSFAVPIIQKGLFVNGSVVFNQSDFEELVRVGRPTKVLVFTETNSSNFNSKVEDYLREGEILGINTRYKCKKRKAWYQIPNIAETPDGFFFKRSHNYPKMLKNEANVLVTDSAYKIKMNQGYNIDSLIFSFYNSLTLLFAELDGRYYGGGVLELIPSEFKKLPMPYVEINNGEFKAFAERFEAKSSILDVLERNDQSILGQGLGLSQEEITKIQRIYRQLISKRFRREQVGEAELSKGLSD